MQYNKIKTSSTGQSIPSAVKSVPINMAQGGENETHKALLNDVVLQNIFKYLDYEDLKTCRDLGSTTWLKNSKKAWWSRTKVAVGYSDDKIAKYLTESEIRSNATNYSFEEYTYTKGSKEFWSCLGHSIKYLEFLKCTFPTIDHFLKLVCIQCPNLERLYLGELILKKRYPNADAVEPLTWKNPKFGEHKKLKFLKIYPDPYEVKFLVHLLSHFPNIQILKGQTVNTDIFKAISFIRQHDTKMLKLNRIQIDTSGFNTYDDDEPLLPVYLDPNLSIERLVIRTSTFDHDTVRDILEHHAQSLKKLILVGNRSGSMEISSRVPLNLLESLKLGGFINPASILKCTPNVRKVQIDCPEFYGLCLGAEPNFCINTCTELLLHAPEHGIKTPKSVLAFFLNVFPNLEILQTGELNNLEFSMICERWTKLRHLFLCSNIVDEIGLLGYDPDTKDSNGTRKPNITNLKDLQSISLVLPGKQKIGNSSVILKELEVLQHLNSFVIRCSKFQLTEEEAWEEIFAKYPNNYPCINEDLEIGYSNDPLVKF